MFAILCAIFASGSAIVQKKTLFKEHAMEFSAVLALFNAVLSIPMLFYIDYSTLEPSLFIFLIIGSILGSAAFLLVAKAVRHMEVSSASPLLILGPGVTAILAFFILGERLTLFQISGIALLIIGMFILESKKNESFFYAFIQIKKSKYIHYIFLALLFYSICSIFDRHVLSTYDITPFSYLAIAHFFIAINFFVMLCIFHDGIEGIKHGIKKAWKPFLLISLLTIGYRVFQLFAVQMAYVALVVAMKRSSALLTTIIGGKFFHEDNLLSKSIACAIMILGAVLIIL